MKKLHPKTPVYYEIRAVEAMKLKTKVGYLKAAEYWAMARLATIGHNRRDRYTEAMNRCLDLAKEIDHER